MKFEVIHDDASFLMTILEGEDYATMFSSYFGFKRVEVMVSVARDLDHLSKVLEDISHGKYEITGNGSLKPLLHVVNYMLGEFKDLCIERGFEEIVIVPYDSRRESAFSFLKRHGFSYKSGLGFVMDLNKTLTKKGDSK